MDLTQEDVVAILKKHESQIEGLVKAVPDNAILLVDNAEELAKGIVLALGLAKTTTLHVPGFLVVSLPDEALKKIFDIVGTPEAARAYFRVTPAAKVGADRARPYGDFSDRGRESLVKTRKGIARGG